MTPMKQERNTDWHDTPTARALAERLHEKYGSEDGKRWPPPPPLEELQSVADEVRQALAEYASGDREAPGTIRDLIDEINAPYQRHIEEAIVEWDISRSDRERLFHRYPNPNKTFTEKKSRIKQQHRSWDRYGG